LSDPSEFLTALKEKKVTRAQFLAIVTGSILGFGGFFRLMQHANTPDLASSDKGVFGEREYGHQQGDQPQKPNKYTYNSEDVFG
jgi:hypothetical protein